MPARIAAVVVDQVYCRGVAVTAARAGLRGSEAGTATDQTEDQRTGSKQHPRP